MKVNGRRTLMEDIRVNEKAEIVKEMEWLNTRYEAQIEKLVIEYLEIGVTRILVDKEDNIIIPIEEFLKWASEGVLRNYYRILIEHGNGEEAYEFVCDHLSLIDRVNFIIKINEYYLCS